ncbi:MAG: cobalamin synthesis protein P47K [Spirochaetales bacterium]|nr:cobalamin synthesis protein P47K [Spirochaetales bacterium]
MGQAPRIAFIGGFLGSGKTTLVWEAARRLMAYGKRVGIITNDQAPDLVDTALLKRHGLNVEEVAGSCFCCNFFGLLDATKALKDAAMADVLLAEPVGSCTDLAATLLQPLRELFSSEFRHSPLAVLADPWRLATVMGGGGGDLNRYTAYVYRMQLEESDIIAVNKIDLLEEHAIADLRSNVKAEFPHARIRFLSARFGIGVDELLAEILESDAGEPRIIDVDYDTYTKGELALGWFNGEFGIEISNTDPDWAKLCDDLLSGIQAGLVNANRSIGHLKLLLSSETGYIVGNVTSPSQPPDLRIEMPVHSQSALMILNARAELPPEQLESTIYTALNSLDDGATSIEVKKTFCIRPGAPAPTYGRG